MDRLPPLTALRGFEAAARHLSFARAAEELHVTPGALSLQIKTLEEHLGAPLFHRLSRAVELTEVGRLLAPSTSDGFDRLRAGWQAARRSLDDNSLTVTAGPAFTAKWLAPRLFRFAQANADIDLRFSATLRLLDFDRDEVDVAIRFGRGDDAGLFSEPLFDEWITPMMTPALARRFGSLDQLAKAPLIHDDSIAFLTPTPDWAAWFRHAGLQSPPPQGPRFSNADHAVDLALEGGGVVLGRSSIVERAFNSGRLVAPFDLTLRVGASYRLVCPKGAETRPAIARFRAWVAEEVTSLHALTRERAPVLIDASGPDHLGPKP